MHNYMGYSKSIVIIFLLVITSQVKAQSLKDALYAGKLKADTGSVVKKGDSLQLRTEQEVKAAAVAAKAKADSLKLAASAPKIVEPSANNNGTTTVTTIVADTINGVAQTDANNPAPVLDNNKVWKKFVDEYTGIIKAEIATSKKVKQGAYSVLIQYEIGADGEVITNSISVSPENSFIVDQVKQRMMMNTPKLTPPAAVNGKVRTVVKKQMLTFIKS